MADEMLGRDIVTPDYYVFYQKDGGYHDFNPVTEFQTSEARVPGIILCITVYGFGDLPDPFC